MSGKAHKGGVTPDEARELLALFERFDVGLSVRRDGIVVGKDAGSITHELFRLARKVAANAALLQRITGAEASDLDALSKLAAETAEKARRLEGDLADERATRKLAEARHEGAMEALKALSPPEPFGMPRGYWR